MATLILPVTNTPANYSFNVDLEGVNYYFDFKWNGRFERWIMTISDDEQNPLQAGISLETGIDLLALVRSDDLPPGNLVLISENPDLEVCGQDNLGDDFYLAYVESE